MILIYDNKGKSIVPQKVSSNLTGTYVGYEKILAEASSTWSYAQHNNQFVTPETHKLCFVEYSNPEGIKSNYWQVFSK